MQYDFQQFNDLGLAQQYATKRAADGWRLVSLAAVVIPSGHAQVIRYVMALGRQQE